MAVFIDDMFRSPLGQLGRMKMSHMFAESPEELKRMAQLLRLNPKWIQNEGQGSSREHFDVSMKYRELAISHGAIEVTMRQMARICRGWRKTGTRENGMSKIWRHVKTGGLYFVHDMNCVIEKTQETGVYYESLSDGRTWVRPKEEFMDGRFVNIDTMIREPGRTILEHRKSDNADELFDRT